MDFSLTEEQELFRDYIRKALDDAGQTKIAREVINDNVDGLKEMLGTLAELGCTGINIPEQYAGLGLGTLDLVPTFEELGRSLLPGVFLETMALAVPLIREYGTEDQKQTYLSSIASGERNITFAVMEPDSDFSPEGIQCSLRKNGDAYVLDGVKTLVPDGELADTFLVLVRTNDDEKEDVLSLVLLDKSPDVEIHRQDCFDETKHLTKVMFDRVEISEKQILGTMNQGWTLLQEGLLYLNAALSSIMVGGMESVIDMATEYAKVREQFGQPIGRFQAIKHKIVDMKLDLEIARSLSHYANWVLETDEEDRQATIFSARSFATDAFINIASHNIQIHGGIGFTEEIDCHLYLKRARYFEHYLGSTNYYNERVASALEW